MIQLDVSMMTMIRDGGSIPLRGRCSAQNGALGSATRSNNLFVQDIRHDNTVRLRKHWPLLPLSISATQPHKGGQRGNEGVLRMQDLRESGLLIRRVRRL